jgi:ElaB/YqjD/DUF883 family membrane-anchored ribosome-binding protein
MAKDVSESLKQNIAELKDRIVEMESSIRNSVKDRLVDAEKKFAHKVEEHPIQSIGIAFGAGLAIGALSAALMRRK